MRPGKEEWDISNFVERIGLDRTSLSGFRIVYIDFEKLCAHNNVAIDCDGTFTYLLNDGKSFRWMKIEDFNEFGVLMAGTKKTKSFKRDYAWIDIVIQDEQYGNLQNSTVLGFKKKLQKVFQYLAEEYGVVVDYRNIKMKSMEVNCTFELEKEFYQYHRVLNLMLYNLPASFKKITQISRGNKKKKRLETETFYRGNTSLEVKIYDKKKQLAETKGIHIPENVMRIEFLLKSTQKIQEVFGSACVEELTDEKLNEFFMAQFERLFVKRFRIWQQANQEQLDCLIKSHKTAKKGSWRQNLLRECSAKEQMSQIPVLLDIESLLQQLRKNDRSRHFQRTKESLLRMCGDNDVYMQKDGAKAEEIISKVKAAYESFRSMISDKEKDAPADGAVA